MEVRYHWTLFKRETSDEPDFYFSIAPKEGIFKPDEAIEFIVTLKSGLYVPLFEFANLIIDEIPIEAIRNPPESLKAISMSSSSGLRPSLTYFEFDLIS